MDWICSGNIFENIFENSFLQGILMPLVGVVGLGGNLLSVAVLSGSNLKTNSVSLWLGSLWPSGPLDPSVRGQVTLRGLQLKKNSATGPKKASGCSLNTFLSLRIKNAVYIHFFCKNSRIDYGVAISLKYFVNGGYNKSRGVPRTSLIDVLIGALRLSCHQINLNYLPAREMSNSFNKLLIALAFFDSTFIIFVLFDYTVVRGV